MYCDIIKDDEVDSAGDRSRHRPIYLLKDLLNRGYTEAQMLIEKEGDEFGNLVQNDSLNKWFREVIVSLFKDMLVKESAPIRAVLQRLHKERGEKQILPKERVGDDVAIVVYDDFEHVDTGDKTHGDYVSDIIEQIGGAKLQAVKVRTGGGGAEEELVRVIETLVENGKTVLVNISRGVEPPFFRDSVGGYIPVEKVEELGRRGVIFGIASGNHARYRYDLHPVFDNVVYAGAVKEEQDFPPESYSNIGLDVNFSSKGNTLCNETSGTSFSLPRVMGTLGLMLALKKEISQKQALAQLNNYGESPKGVFAPYLGKVIFPEKVVDRMIEEEKI